MIGPLTNFEKVKEFHNAMEARRNVWPPPLKMSHLRYNLMEEELEETVTELFPRDNAPINKTALAKELADLLYVTYGTADAFGIDIDRVFEEVHRSNMSKLVDGKPLKREDGKILKGPNYTPPNLSFIGE